MSSSGSLFRVRGGESGEKVEFIELFFDLVFVFAVTQLSHALIADLSAGGMLRTALLMTAVWWVWVFTSWATNWLAPERIPVRLCLFVMMFAGLLIAVAIPRAWDDLGMLFAAGYVFMQLGRTSFFLWASRQSTLEMQRNFQRILIWFAAAAVFWIVGGIAAPGRMGWWALALGVELLGPIAYFRVPGLGASSTASWNIAGGHLAERCGLFVIIALGESLLVTGTTFAELDWRLPTVHAFFLAALGTVLMWWIYFDLGAHRSQRRIQHAADPGRQGRLAYTYLHLIIVAGIIISAVGDEIVLTGGGHAAQSLDGQAGDSLWITVLAGPACYLLGNALFKWVTNDRRVPPLSHLAGIALLLLLTWPAATHHFGLLQLGTFSTVILLLVAVWESIALRRPRYLPV